MAVFAVDGDLPRYVTEVSTAGHWPRHFALIGAPPHGAHLYVADERAGAIAVFPVDPATGVPGAAGAPAEVPSPTCILPARSLNFA